MHENKAFSLDVWPCIVPRIPNVRIMYLILRSWIGATLKG
jgi:hypothetical protein